MSSPVATQGGATMTANQVVAYNMAKARALRGWTQERVGEELAPYLGVKLSLKSISAMERSARQSERIRVFSADDLLALSRGFDLPLGFFLVPPPPAQGIRFRSAAADEDPLVLLDAVLGTPENLAEWEQALCECAAAMTPTPVAEWLRVHVARSASAFGGLIELAEQCRRMVRLLEDLDVVCPSDMQD
jgi:transcriptional regulator with XRE-family HTH domain